MKHEGHRQNYPQLILRRRIRRAIRARDSGRISHETMLRIASRIAAQLDGESG